MAIWPKPSTSDTFEAGKIQEPWLTVLVGVGRCQTYDASDRGVCQILVVWTQGSVCDGPLAKRMYHCLVVFPFVRIGGVVHADPKVLRAREEEVAIEGELTRVTSRVMVDYRVGSRRWDQVLQPVVQPTSQRRDTATHLRD